LSTTIETLRRQAQLVLLFHAEDAIRRRCARVAARLELTASALVLLEVACHADAALADLDDLAGARGIVLDTRTARVRAWVDAVFWWAIGLWPVSAARGYRVLLAGMQRNLALASMLRHACVESNDSRLADWCALWSQQRTTLAQRLAETLDQAA
jgi:hypothetical protein